MIYKIQLTYAVATDTLRDAQEAAMLHYASLYARCGDDPNGLPAMGALYDVQVAPFDRVPTFTPVPSNGDEA